MNNTNKRKVRMVANLGLKIVVKYKGNFIYEIGEDHELFFILAIFLPTV
jgi:hypothetical protein